MLISISPFSKMRSGYHERTAPCSIPHAVASSRKTFSKTQNSLNLIGFQCLLVIKTIHNHPDIKKSNPKNSQGQPVKYRISENLLHQCYHRSIPKFRENLLNLGDNKKLALVKFYLHQCDQRSIPKFRGNLLNLRDNNFF